MYVIWRYVVYDARACVYYMTPRCACMCVLYDTVMRVRLFCCYNIETKIGGEDKSKS